MANDPPELPPNPTPADVNDRLDWHDGELKAIRGELDTLQASLKASRAGDHERATELLDKLDEKQNER